MANGIVARSAPLDSGLAAFSTRLGFLDRAAESGQLHLFAAGSENFIDENILRAATRLEMKAGREHMSPERRDNVALPVITLQFCGLPASPVSSVAKTAGYVDE